MGFPEKVQDRIHLWETQIKHHQDSVETIHNKSSPPIATKVRRSKSYGDLGSQFQYVEQNNHNLNSNLNHIEQVSKRTRAITQSVPKKELPPTPAPSPLRERAITHADSPRAARRKEFFNLVSFRKLTSKKKPNGEKELPKTQPSPSDTRELGYRTDYYNALFSAKADPKWSLPQEQEKLMGELIRKMTEFMEIACKLKEALDKSDVLLFDQSRKTVIEKEVFIEALLLFNATSGKLFNQPIQIFNTALTSDAKLAKEMFGDLSKFLKSLQNLTESYIRCFGYNSISVLENGINCRIQLDGNRFGQSVLRDATDFLNAIPREISQYSSLMKDLSNNAFQNAMNFENLVLLLGKLQGEMDKHLSLFE